MDSIDVMISADTTGSMYPALTQVRRNIDSLVTQLFNDIPNIRIGIIAHGDYCDEGSTYITKMLDLTTEKAKLCKFIREVEATGGGDCPECYEWVLNQVRKASWSSGKQKVVIMVGDDVPHPVNYPGNKQKIDWKNEAGLLKEAGIKVFAVQALGRGHATSFYEKLAELTNGVHLELNQFADLQDLIMAACYKQDSDKKLEDFEDSLIVNGRINRNTDAVIGKLLGRKESKRFKTAKSKLGAVPGGRFQVIAVDTNTPIKDFVLDQGLTFAKGRGFYEFTKRKKIAKIQDYKEVILMDNNTGDLFNGDAARKIAGIPIGSTVQMQPKPVEGYTVFIQSTSVNRMLQGGTKFLYEVDDWSD